MCGVLGECEELKAFLGIQNDGMQVNSTEPPETDLPRPPIPDPSTLPTETLNEPSVGHFVALCTHIFPDRDFRRREAPATCHRDLENVGRRVRSVVRFDVLHSISLSQNPLHVAQQVQEEEGPAREAGLNSYEHGLHTPARKQQIMMLRMRAHLWEGMEASVGEVTESCLTETTFWAGGAAVWGPKRRGIRKRETE
jgi:hypothetical protein